MINNRQVGRRRGRGGGNNNGPRQGGGQQGNGSRIDSRARGNASQLYEKYKNMAADTQRAGDRVTTEYYLQFADHYFRVLSEQRGRVEEQQPRRGRDDFDDDGDDEFGEEGEPIRAKETWGEQAANDGGGQRAEMRDDRGNDRPREDRPREDRQRDDGLRDDRPRENRPRDDRPRGDRDGYRRDAGSDGRGDARGEGRPARSGGEWQDRDQRRERRPEQPVEVAGQRRADPIAANESLENRAEEVLDADRPLDAPVRRRGRPRRESGDDAAPMAAEANGFEVDRLPPSLTVAANDEAPEAKPRRRRARPAEDTPTAAE